MGLAIFTARKAVVEQQIANFNAGVEQAGRGDKYVKFRGVEELYKELRYLDNQIARLEGRSKTRVYIKNGGRGYV